MTDHIADNINAVVKPDMTLVHCGDWSFGGYTNIKKFRDKINCKRIYLILGNHDEHIQADKNNELRKLFYRVDHYREFNVDGQIICCDHYPMRSWNHMNKDSWMLHGHTHGSLVDDHTVLSIDIGMDTAWVMTNDEMYMTTNFHKHFYYDENHCRQLRSIDLIPNVHSRFHPYTMAELNAIMSYKLQFRRGVDHHN
jgi:calcineurin-like phosphoesterase family protein